MVWFCITWERQQRNTRTCSVQYPPGNHGNNCNNNQEVQHQSWNNEATDDDEYDGNHEDNIPRLATRYLTALLRLRGGNSKLQVETVTEEDPDEVLEEQSHKPTKRTSISTPLSPLPPQKPGYNHMADKPPPATTTPL